ncbi:hypothetical protein ACWD4V_22885 [Streptomyces tsukubensis]
MLRTDDFADTGWVTVRVEGDRELTVSFDTTPGTGPGGPSAQTLAALLPRVRDLLADFGTVRRTAVDHLWQWGAEPSDTDDDRAEFIATMHPAELVVREDGGFALHYTETGGRMLDGYWPAVHFTADRTPTEVTVES